MKTATIHRVCSIAKGLATAAALAMLQSGCDNRHLLGAVEGDGGPPPGNDGAMAMPADAARDAAGSPQDGAVLPPTESWTGYVENYRFPSGSDAIKIAFAIDPAGQVVGTVTFGNATPPPPPTDPNVGYPADLLTQSSIPDVISAPHKYIAEGYAFSMRDGTLVGGRLRFGIRTWEVWKNWCTLQTPVPASGQCDEPVCASLCLPNGGFMTSASGCAMLNPATNAYEPVDCGKLALCGPLGVCICDPSACRVQDNAGGMMFDITMSSDERARGSADGAPIGGHNLQFAKDR